MFRDLMAEISAVPLLTCLYRKLSEISSLQRMS